MEKQSKILLFTAITIATLLAIGAGTVSAADSAAPGDLLYGVDRAVENTLIALTTDPAEKAELELDLIDERIEELDDVLEGDDDGIVNEEDLEQATDELNKSYTKALGQTEAMIQARENGDVADAVQQRVMEKLQEKAQVHEEAMEQVKAKVSANTKDNGNSNSSQNLDKAIGNSQKGNSRAQEVLGE